MSFFPRTIIDAVDQIARVRYLDKHTCRIWNDNRRSGELRLLTGWMWASRKGGEYRQGFKTQSVAYRDAYYALIQHRAAPGGSLTPIRSTERIA